MISFYWYSFFVVICYYFSVGLVDDIFFCFRLKYSFILCYNEIVICKFNKVVVKFVQFGSRGGNGIDNGCYGVFVGGKDGIIFSDVFLVLFFCFGVRGVKEKFDMLVDGVMYVSKM